MFFTIKTCSKACKDFRVIEIEGKLQIYEISTSNRFSMSIERK